MSVFNEIRKSLKHDISEEELVSKAQAIASEVGINLDQLHDSTANTYNQGNIDFIAEEIDKLQESAITLSTSDTALKTTNKKSKKSLVESESSSALIEPKSSSTGSANDSIQKLIPVVKELRKTIADQTDAMKNAVKQKVQEEKDSTVEELLQLTNNLQSDIVSELTEKLRKGSDNNQAFLVELESAFKEAWGN